MREARWRSRGRITLFVLGFVLPQAVRATAAEYELRPLSGPRADVAALILGGRESGALRVAGLAVAECASRSPASGTITAEVRIGVEIEGRSLLDAIASLDQSKVPQSVRVEFYAYVMTRAGEISASLSKWVRLPLADLASQLPDGGVKLTDSLELPPGEYQIRLLVRDARSQQFALRVLGVDIRSDSDPRPSMTPPLLSAGETWLTAAADAPAPILASALPVLVPDMPQGFAVRGCHLADAAFEVRLLRRDRQAVEGARIRFSTPEEAGVGWVVRGEIEIEKMETGLYLLEVEARTDSGETTQTLPVFVTDTDQISTWAAQGGLTAQTEPEPGDLDLATESRGSKRIRAIESRYRRVLGKLASGRLGSAVTALAELEQQVLASHDNPRKAMKWLSGAQDRVAYQILGYDPECLLPLLRLHLELQDRYVSAGDVSSHLLQATRTRIRLLAQVYAKDGRQEMAPALASMSLVELATGLQKTGYLISALIVLREAWALDQSNTDVILDLAYQYEHHQFRQEALDLLLRLVELDPRSDEGRLRLAMNLLHAQRTERAVALLRQVVDNGSSEWVLAVAYQELGHYLLGRKDFDEAVRLLEQAVRRLPNIQRLYVELAYAYDRNGQRRLGREVLARLPADLGHPSPRLRYRARDRGEVLLSRSELTRHATARLPLLAAALSEEGEPE